MNKESRSPGTALARPGHESSRQPLAAQAPLAAPEPGHNDLVDDTQRSSTEEAILAGRGVSSSSKSWSSAAHPTAPASSAIRSLPSSVLPKPLGTIRLTPDGRCGCAHCRLEATLDDTRRDRALMEIVYDLGREALRAQALRQVAPFLASFGEAS